MALVELRNVSKIYHLGGEEIRALDDLSLDIQEGEFISIIGPSPQPEDRVRLSVLQSPAQAQRLAKRRTADDLQRSACPKAARACAGGAQDGGDGKSRPAPSDATLRRPAATGCHRPRAGQQS